MSLLRGVLAVLAGRGGASNVSIGEFWRRVGVQRSHGANFPTCTPYFSAAEIACVTQKRRSERHGYSRKNKLYAKQTHRAALSQLRRKRRPTDGWGSVYTASVPLCCRPKYNSGNTVCWAYAMVIRDTLL